MHNTVDVKRSRKAFWTGLLMKLGNPILAIIIAFIMGGLMVLISGDSPFQTYAALLKGAFGNWTAIQNTIRYTIPIVLLAYSFSLCSQCGYFNISQESQIYGAALAMVMVSELTHALPSWARLVLIMIAACIAAAIACVVPALAKFKLGVSEVVVGVMLNYLMAYLTKHMIAFSFIAQPGSSSIMSLPIPESIGAGTITLCAVVIVILYQFVLKKTIPGYRLLIVGQNQKFATASGLPSMRVLLSSAVVGGILAGICAIGEMMGYYHIIYSDFANGIGFNGMTAALLGGHNAIGMFAGALLLGALKSGSVMLTIITDVPSELVDCVQGFVMFFATISLFHTGGWPRKKAIKKAAVFEGR